MRARCASSGRTQRSRIADLGGLAVHPDFRGAKVADTAARLFQRHLFDELGFHRVQMEIYGFNERAMRHAERAGFTREGVRRKAYWRNDEWVDGVLYGLVAEDLDDVASDCRSRSSARPRVGARRGSTRRSGQPHGPRSRAVDAVVGAEVGVQARLRVDVTAVDEHGRRAEHAIRLGVLVRRDLDDLDLRRNARLVHDALDDDERHPSIRAVLAREDLDPDGSVRIGCHVGPPPQVSSVVPLC